MTNAEAMDATVYVVSLVLSSVAFLCTTLTIIVIKYMNKRNGYIQILWSMCLCQLVYDATFFFHQTDRSSLFRVAFWNGLQFFSGLSVAIWTNLLTLTILYVVTQKRSFNVIKNYCYLRTVALIPPIILLLAAIGAYKDEEKEKIIAYIYFWARIASILLNFLVFVIIAYWAYKLKQGLKKANKKETKYYTAILVLSHRLIYYPIAQSVARSGAAIYEPVYGFGPFEGETASTTQFVFELLYTILNPSAGILYMIIFLIMQPMAFDIFMKLFVEGEIFYRLCGIRCCAPGPNNYIENAPSGRKTLRLARTSKAADGTESMVVDEGRGGLDNDADGQEINIRKDTMDSEVDEAEATYRKSLALNKLKVRLDSSMTDDSSASDRDTVYMRRTDTHSVDAPAQRTRSTILDPFAAPVGKIGKKIVRIFVEAAETTAEMLDAGLQTMELEVVDDDDLEDTMQEDGGEADDRTIDAESQTGRGAERDSSSEVSNPVHFGQAPEDIRDTIKF